MAKTQLPIDGKLGKQFKVTSPFGWRKDPLGRASKKHHNGVDLWGAAGTIYIEAFHDGRVIHAGPSKRRKADGSVGGFGYHVIIRHQINGKSYTSCYAHLKEGSIKVKVGQKVTAGTVLGVMGTTGDSTGKHLHWEIWQGKTHGWSADGKGFLSPLDFAEGLIKAANAAAAAPKATPEDAPVAPVATHGSKPAAAKAVAKPVVAKPVVAPAKPVASKAAPKAE